MPLSEKDVQLLEKAGYRRAEFAYENRNGYVQLRNKKGYCVFYNREKHVCTVYRRRPAGCRLYPVIYSEDEGVVTDNICPARRTVTEAEIKRKTGALLKLIQQTDDEADRRRMCRDSNC